MTLGDQERLLWLRSLSDGGPLFWLAFGGSLLYVLARKSPEPYWRHFLKTMSSGGMALGLHSDLAWIFSGNLGLTAVTLVVFGMLVLDGVTAALQRREFVQELLKMIVSRGTGGGGK
jgi:predicted MPP superfamily phosphohydrolase